MKNKKAFTIVEIIIVVGILSVLLVVGVMIYQKWIGNSRDSKRLSDLEIIESSLNMDAFSANKRLVPDNYINIDINGKTIGYQGYFGTGLQQKLGITKDLKDPLDKTYYTYYTNSSKTEYQLLTFVENKKRLILQGGDNVDASSLKDRFPLIKGDDLGVLMDYDSYNPIQEVASGSFDIANTTNHSIFYINQDISFDGIGEVLINAFATITKENKYIKADSNLIGLFDFDNINGTGANDYSVYGHNGTITGANIINAKLGKGLEFDGIDDMFTLNVDLNQWLGESGTITLWMKTTQVGNNTARLAPAITGTESSGDGDDIFWGRIDNAGYINIMAGNDKGARSNYPINDGNWYHIGLSRDYISGETKVYVNGELQDTEISETGAKGTPFWSFGVRRDDQTADGSYDNYFQGSMDQIAIYKRVLLDKEVKLIYDYSLERDF